VIIEVHEVPDAALSALFEAAPDEGWPDGSREDWRQALAAALTVWENRPRDLMPLIAGHDCTWRTVGCGDVRTQVLTGTWTMEQLRA
jgi:hypothetical protein